jgi:hypothetical protein
MAETTPCDICGAACTYEATFCGQCFAARTPMPRPEPAIAGRHPEAFGGPAVAAGMGVAAAPGATMTAAPASVAQPESHPTMHDVTYGRAPFITVSRPGREPAKRGFLHIKYHGILKPTLMGILVLILIGTVAWWWMGRKIELPDSIAGLPRVTDSATEAGADEAAQMVEDQLHRPADAAVYGDPATGTGMVVITVAGSSGLSAAEDLASAGTDPSGQVRVLTAGTKSFQSEGADFACAPVTGTPFVTWCFFQDGSISGLVMTTYDRMRNARTLAVETYRALGA